MKIGLLKEGKTPTDKRVALSPSKCRELFAHYPQLKVIVQPSPRRCFMDEEYEDAGILLDDNLHDCDLLLGIKEVRPKDLIADKTYMFFSHTAKKQSHNKELLREIISKKITLIDYEYLKDDTGKRLIGFGHWAGIVGTYNGFRAISIRNKKKDPQPAHTCKNYTEFLSRAKKIDLPPVKIVVTGDGRVAKGAVELLEIMNIRRVSVDEYLGTENFDRPVYVQIDVDSYNKHKDGKTFDMGHFFHYPEEYETDFYRFAKTTDYLIMAAFWDSKAPRLFSKEEMKQPDFRIRVISDITCDINGSVPSTLRTSTIEDPFYGYNPQSCAEELAFTDPSNISVIAIDNLPNELPRAASEDFGKTLISSVFPHFVSKDKSGIIKSATIVEKGVLTDKFAYLKEWVDS